MKKSKKKYKKEKIDEPWKGWIKQYLNDWVAKSGSFEELKSKIEVVK